MNELNKLDTLIAKRQGATPVRQSRTALLQRRAEQADRYQPKSNQLVDLVLVIDTTGSMNSFLTLVKRRFGELLQHLCAEESLQNLRFSVVLYKDHGSEASGYDIKEYVSPTSAENFSNKDEIEEAMQFIRKYGHCSGGGDAEALGAALYKISEFNWRASKRIVVNLGDKPSHGYHSFGGRDSLNLCPYRMSHQKIIETYRRKDIKLFSVCCGDFKPTKRQYQELSANTGGAYIEFDQLDSLDDILLFLELSIKATAQLVTPQQFLADGRHQHSIGQRTYKALLTAFNDKHEEEL